MISFVTSTDRVYQGSDFNRLQSLILTDGVFNTSGSIESFNQNGGLKVKANVGTRTVTINPGTFIATITADGESSKVICKIDSSISTSLSTNESYAIRNDAVIIKVLQSVIDGDSVNEDGDNVYQLVAIAGTSENTITDSQISTALAGDPFIRLANVRVANGFTSIMDSNIEDVRQLVSISNGNNVKSPLVSIVPVYDSPVEPKNGDMWIEASTGLLRLYSKGDLYTLNSDISQYSVYPSGGVYNNTSNEPSYSTNENTGDAGNILVITQWAPFDPGVNFSNVGMQIFTMPVLESISFRAKMDRQINERDFSVELWNVSANKPTTLIETIKTFSVSEIGSDNYIDIVPTSSLVPGTTYGLAFICKTLTVYNSSGTDEEKKIKSVRLDKVHFVNDTVFKGVASAYSPSTYKTSLSSYSSGEWSYSTNQQLNMEVYERGNLFIGELDQVGKNNIISQVFTAETNELVGIQLLKGEVRGTPTSDVIFSIYEADVNNNPTNNVISSTTISSTVLSSIPTLGKVNVTLDSEGIEKGKKYVATISTDSYSNVDNFSFIITTAGNSTTKRKTTSEGWVYISGTILLGQTVTKANKIVVSSSEGIDESMVPIKKPRVLNVTINATPVLPTDYYDAFVLDGLNTNISNMSTNTAGSPDNFERKTFRIKDNGTSRTITWGASYENKGATLPTSTTVNKKHTVIVEWDSESNKWGCIQSITQP